MREIACWTTPGVCSAALSARSAPSGSPSRLRWLMVACTRYRRPSGSGSSHGRSANTNEMWLPSTSSGERTFTGTIAFSGVRYSPRRIMRARMAPVTAASMTSLTVVSYVRFTFCRSSSGRWVQARRRSGERAPLIELAGAARTAWPSARPILSAAPAVWRAVLAGALAARIGQRTRPSCCETRSRMPRSTRRSPLGRGAGCQSSGSGAAGSGVASSTSDPSSTAAMPSTMQ